MSRKLYGLMIVVLAVSMMVFPAVEGSETKMNDIYLEPGEFIEEQLYLISKESEVHMNVSSTRPVDVYVIDDRNFDPYSSGYQNWSRADFSREGILELNENWTKTDDKDYYFVIHNSGNDTAVVDYSYTDTFGEDIEDILESFSMLCFGLIAVVVIVIVIIVIVVIYVVVKGGKDKERQYYPPPPM
ncbi:MAG: hypothetical protein ACQESD_05925 [Thermoplasmatota archaeon]